MAFFCDGMGKDQIGQNRHLDRHTFLRKYFLDVDLKDQAALKMFDHEKLHKYFHSVHVTKHAVKSFTLTQCSKSKSVI